MVLIGVGAIGLVATNWWFGSLSAGWNSATWWGGLARVLFSYPLGVLMYRIRRAGRLPRVPLPFAATATILVTGVVLVSWHTLHHMADLLAVTLLMPLVLLAGISAPPSRRLRRVEHGLGALSFPIYALHYPLIQLWVTYGPPLTPPVRVGVMLSIVAAAYLADRAFDRPVRAWLTATLRPRERDPKVAVAPRTLPRRS
jgi:peptidoglycan/LPS O-acetylase OafA/YrhL